MADETAVQLSRQLNSKGIHPDRIERVDVVHGGDHGCKAFIAGSRISVILSKNNNTTDDNEDEVKHESFSFEISVAEILCRKDNAEILTLTIKDDLTKGLKTIAEEHLNITVDDQNKVVCSFGEASTDAAFPSIKPHLYVVGDLAYYGMILGKEGMSGDHCHLCKLSAKEFVNLAKNGELWVHEELAKMGEAFVEVQKVKPKTNPKNGVKAVTWWPFIPMNHFVVPLLHCLIGVGDNIFTKFRDIVNDKIEYLSPVEVDTRLAVGAMEVKIDTIRASLAEWKKSPDGKELISQDGKIKRAKKALNKLEILNGISGVTSSSNNSPNQDFLEEVTAFIDGDDDCILNDEDEDGMEADVDEIGSASATPTPNATANSAVSDLEKGIEKVKLTIKKSQKIFDSLKAKRVQLFEAPLKRGKAYLKTLKTKIATSKSEHKKDGDGIEAKLFQVLKIKYGVKIQAYHGGTLTGKDIQKVMENASAIFTEFASILKANKRKDCELCNECIDALCARFSNLFVLWDGAFSYASKLDPAEDDIKQYSRFVTAAVHAHIQEGLSVTPKVHLMWKHVAQQMRLPGGLAWKREDWVEHMHQITNRLRTQFRTTQDKDVRAQAMARAYQQNTNPEANAWREEVNAESERGPRANHVSTVAARKRSREEARISVIEEWEVENPKDK